MDMILKYTTKFWSSPESLLVGVLELRACTVRVLSREPNILPNFSHLTNPRTCWRAAHTLFQLTLGVEPSPA